MTEHRTDGVLLKYIRGPKKERRGLVLAFQPKDRNYAVVTYSLCCPKDKFDKEEGIKVAMDRMLDLITIGKEDGKRSPLVVRRDVADMMGRALAYFKGAKEVRVVR